MKSGNKPSYPCDLRSQHLSRSARLALPLPEVAESLVDVFASLVVT